MARPQKVRCICSVPEVRGFFPESGSGGTVIITYDEYEVLRLLDYARFSQEKCAERLKVSRSTVTRIYDSVRNKIADAFVNGKKIELKGGDVVVCERPRPECAGAAHCCHFENHNEGAR